MTKTKTHQPHPSRYRSDSGKICIEVSLRSPKQLFDARDPAPFIDRDLDDDAVDYIVSSTEEFPIRAPLKLVLHFSEKEDSSLSPHEISEAIHSYFYYQDALLGKKLERTLKIGRVFAVLGSLFLMGCLFAAGLATKVMSGTMAKIVHEGFTITGWVALWRPVQLFLYDWIPMFEKRRYYRKLSEVEIEVVNPR